MSTFNRLSLRPLGRGAALVTIALAATAILGSGPVGAASSAPCANGLILDLANPGPGDILSAGDYIVSGFVRDPSPATSGAVDRVDLFVGNRDAGGTEVGSAVPKQGAFTVTVKLPTNIEGGTNFVAYAHSSLSSQEAVVSVPVFLGVVPTPTPRPSSDIGATPVVPTSPQTSCAPASSSSVSAVPATTTGSTTTTITTAPATPGPATTTAAAASTTSNAAVLQVANPSAGDILLLGDYFISGLAYVPNSPQGVGVDRVDFFLGSRDSGGEFLGSAVPGQNNTGLNATPGSLLAQGGFVTKVTVPTQTKGGTTFFAYAHNSLTGQETVVSVPVFVGAEPTPTPRPS
jgi:hypothetical protein